jgi:hypothetical protein
MKTPRECSGALARPGSRDGFTLIELMIACSVFMLAAQAAESMLERLKGAEFSEVFVRFNATADDDPATGDSPGSDFAVTGLGVREGDADGMVGHIEFPGDGKELREDEEDRDLGLPRDLNRDGDVDAADHAGDYCVLPVRVVLQWRGANGNRAMELVTVLNTP